MKKILVLFVSLFSLFFVTSAYAEITFEDLTLAPDSSWNGSTGAGGLTSFTSGGAQFNNFYNTTWASWAGYGYSNKTDTTLSGTAGQYNAIPGSGAQGSANYGVAYVDTFGGTVPTITFPAGQIVTGLYVTNNNYAYYSMLNGDAFAKKFAAGDWFLLTITGRDAGGVALGTVQTYLAVGTDILSTWRWVDLRSLGWVKSLEFTLTSSDTGAWGMNTPAYFCIDNIDQQAIPTLSEWGMIMFSVLLAGMALWIMRRKKTTEPV